MKRKRERDTRLKPPTIWRGESISTFSMQTTFLPTGTSSNVRSRYSKGEPTALLLHTIHCLYVPMIQQKWYQAFKKTQFIATLTVIGINSIATHLVTFSAGLRRDFQITLN